MKAIIDRKSYDTEKATCVAEHLPAIPGSDFRFFREYLYRTESGAWFLQGEGGALSHWSQATDDGGSGYGEGIRPLSDDEALDWLERRKEIEVIEQYFPAEIEDA